MSLPSYVRRIGPSNTRLPTSAGHPFYARLNRVLDDAGFDTFVEAQCAQFYADGIGRPSLAPGRCLRNTRTEAPRRCDATSSGWTRPRRCEYRQTTVQEPWGGTLAVKARGRRRWKKTSGYHGQARVENAFFRYKSIIGDSLRACSAAGRGTEVVLACNILNQMTGLGRPMSYRIGR